MQSKIYSAVLVLFIAAFSACRPDYYTPAITPVMDATLIGNYNSSNSSHTYVFGANISGIINVRATPFVQYATLNISYTKSGITTSFPGFPKTVYSNADVNGKNYNISSPISGSYTLQITYTLPNGKSVTQSYNINPSVTTISGIRLASQNSGSAYGFTFATGLASTTRSFPIDFYMSGTSTTFNGIFKTSSGGSEIVMISAAAYNTATTQGDLDYLYDAGTPYSSYTPTIGTNAYIIKCASPQNGHNYGAIKVTAISDGAGSASDNLTFDYKY